ncbi:N-formylglutamate amidohydrolase [Wenxinia saemankumensis]|uniref:N-formylglutamate amidohydrolase n=1 Tax=Wenxinia saemankumensis TaxID=1447782 RepID=A0A1M6E628_9RHOB|nr:N-formylglutamate amidohydrolase [Wenxinia saemankumensis]SHI80865.1 N-formylglutamate amidohydrolase [Wenxinia saemankumensis]
MSERAFTLVRPLRRTTCVVFASPHSGRHYPDEMRRATRLDETALRSSEDAFVDELFAAAPGQGAPLIAATAARAWLDLNRAQDELDPALVEGVRRGAHNPRVASGLGVVPRVVAGGRPIYEGKLPLDAARARIAAGWVPYHAALSDLLEESREAFGEAILIDCHSMPHEALDQGPGRRADVILGDRFGAAARGDLVDRIEAVFAGAGLRVARNMPFAGAYTTQAYGRPARRRHAVQVELDRALYMDEARVEKAPGFDAFRAVMDGIVADLAALGRPQDRAVAAE